jgi:hypothetical protein
MPITGLILVLALKLLDTSSPTDNEMFSFKKTNLTRNGPRYKNLPLFFLLDRRRPMIGLHTSSATNTFYSH